MTTRQPGDVIAVCPVCGIFVDVLNPEQVLRVEGMTDEEHIEQVVETNSIILRAHVETSHTVHEVMLVLGQARQALIDVKALTTGTILWPNRAALHGVVDRGLGGK